MDIKFPSWLFFGLYYGMKPNSKWNEEKADVANRIIESINQSFKYQPEVLKKVLYINKDDDCSMYGNKSVSLAKNTK